MDFAVGKINVTQNNYTKPVNEEITPVIMGTDVTSFGYYNDGKDGKNLALRYRFYKGYISFLGNKPDAQLRSKSWCEVSFPSLSGFSGTPVFLSGTDGLVGMLYGGKESDIEVFSYSEVNEGEKIFSEKIYRIMEFGLMHTISDIKTYLKEMEIKAFI